MRQKKIISFYSYEDSEYEKKKWFIFTTVTLLTVINDNSEELPILNPCSHMLFTRKHYHLGVDFFFHSIQNLTNLCSSSVFVFMKSFQLL